MNDQDLRDCFAMFIVNGLLSRASVFDMEEVWKMADAMLEARDNKSTVGLPPIRRKTRSK
jgi:hypothetical protein